VTRETYTALQVMIICVPVFALGVTAIAQHPDFFNGCAPCDDGGRVP
jgi:hypothetical protein